MKTIANILIICAAIVCLIACNSKELTRDKAFDILQASIKKLPSGDTISTNVSLNNPYMVADYKLLSLEKEGYWYLNPDKKVKQNVVFTAKAKPYLIGDIEKRKEGSFISGYYTFLHQKVMTAKLGIGEVTGIELEPGDRKAKVEFTLKFSPTPFAKLDESIENFGSKKLKAPMALYDDGWRIEGNSLLDRLSR